MKRHIKKVINGVIAASIALGVAQGVSPQATYAAQIVAKDYTNHAYKTHIEYVVKNRLMWTYPDGNFRPDQAITQADLVVGLANAKGLTTGIPVSGLPANHWAKVYYERAKKDGILDSVVINPSKVLNREEAALLMNNSWKSMFKSYQKKRPVYSDVAVNSGFLPKKAGKFANGVSTTAYDGLGSVTRGEEAIALSLLHKDVLDTKNAEIIAQQLHNSLKISGGYLKGKVPTASGKDIRMFIVFKNDNAASFYSGDDFMVNASQVKFMQFTVKNSGQSKALASYEYSSGTDLTRKNTR
ncbi:S-layer homology domain-containing protein [Brevibacillus brevis]|uniref:S-layer homology domain-containing protein n=1 Tax=Brevibacillus brevis TaxID=1393 RepID=A0ABY9TF15_BREBE|nr:S-layer homology domain-containing protein [Brevibacillus brevis]WNC17892.1 S-layer homology domain-containing protein [Brevibacillus brevis]